LADISFNFHFKPTAKAIEYKSRRAGASVSLLNVHRDVQLSLEASATESKWEEKRASHG
jgi:hypothetical protein